MADKVQFYTEGGMPSNRQVCGVRNAAVWSVESDNNVHPHPLVVGDNYWLFDLQSNEVVQAMGIDVGKNSDAGGVVKIWLLHADGVTTTELTENGGADMDVDTMIKIDIDKLPKDGYGDRGVVFATFEGDTAGTGGNGVDINVFAVVANIENLATFTKADTPAP